MKGWKEAEAFDEETGVYIQHFVTDYAVSKAKPTRRFHCACCYASTQPEHAYRSRLIRSLKTDTANRTKPNGGMNYYICKSCYDRETKQLEQVLKDYKYR